LLPYDHSIGLAGNLFSPTRSSLKHPHHPHGNQLCNRRLDRQLGIPRNESPLAGGPLPQVEEGCGSSTTSQRSIWMVYDKSEEHLDRLLQVGGEFGSSTSNRRRASQHLSNGFDPRRLLGLHQQRHTFTKRPPRLDGASILVGRARASEEHKSSKLPDSAHPFSALILVVRARASEGQDSSKLPGSAHPFNALILVGLARASEGHESSKLPGSGHPFCASILVGWDWV
jgi:hypothetical protein